MNKFYIEKIEMKNFRESDIKIINLKPGVNIIENSESLPGKYVLDAIAVVVSGFLSGFDDIKTTKILDSDSVNGQFPVTIQAAGVYPENNAFCFEQSLNFYGRKNTKAGSKELFNFGSKLQKAVQSGDVNYIFPMVAYYDLGNNPFKSESIYHHNTIRFNRQYGYHDCISAGSNYIDMLYWIDDMNFIALQDMEIPKELNDVMRAAKMAYCKIHNIFYDFDIKYDIQKHKLYTCKNNDNGKAYLCCDEIQYRIYINLIIDIAVRMAMLNPASEDLLQSPGIVLINNTDEMLLDVLKSVFSNMQFIASK